jgi:glutaredoxin-like protein NrdH
MPQLTVHTLPNCPQCTMTKKLLDREGIPYDVVKLEDHPELMAKFKDEGLLQAPIIVVGHDGRRWTGFLPAEIMKLKAGHEAPVAE